MKMIPSILKFNELLRIIKRGKYEENPKKHEKYKNLAFLTFEKSRNPKLSWSKNRSILKETWGHCFNSLKFQPNASNMWELLGDASFERTETGIALMAYQKTLEMHPENEELLRFKSSETTKLNNLLVALLGERLPLKIHYSLLKCINCGVSGKMYQYHDTKKYMVRSGPVKHKVTSSIIVPLCENCNASPKHNTRRNLKYGMNGASIRVGGRQAFSYDLWQSYVVLEKYKAGQIDTKLFNSFA